MSIIQRIIISQEGAYATERAIEDVNDALDEQGQAGRRAAAGLDQAGRAARDSGREAGGAGGWWASFKSVIGGTNEGVGKITAGIQLLGGALGALIGGGVIGGAVTAAITAFEQLRDILTDEEGRLRANVEAVNLLQEAYARFKLELKQVTDQTKELGKARDEGATAYARGLGISRDQLSASGFLSGASQGAEANAIRKRRAELETEMLLATNAIEGIKREFAGDNARISNFSDAWNRRLDAAKAEYDRLRTPLGYGYAEQKKGKRPEPSTFFGLDRTVAGIQAGLAAGPAYGPADDPFARQLAAFEAPDLTKPFAAAEAAVNAFAEARDRAFDTERASQFFDVVNASVDQFGQGVASSAANAILFGTSFSKGVNTAMKALAAQAAAQALWEGAQAVGALAMGRPDAAALHWEAAALYTGVAAVAALGAAVSGGLRSGGGRRGGAGAGRGTADEVGRDGAQPSVFAPTIIVGLDGEPIYRRMHQINDSYEGSRAQRRFATAA